MNCFQMSAWPFAFKLLYNASYFSFSKKSYNFPNFINLDPKLKDAKSGTYSKERIAYVHDGWVLVQ